MGKLGDDAREIADKMAGKVDTVDGEINDCSAARLREIIPITGHGGIGGVFFGIDGAHLVDFADEPGVNQRFGNFHLCPEALVEPDLQDSFGLVGCGNHRAAFGDGDGERLFAQDVFAMICRRNRAFRMKPVRRCDDDGVNTACLQHLIEIVEGFAAEIAGDRLGAGEVGIEDSGESGLIRAADDGAVAEAHDRAGTAEPDPNRRFCDLCHRPRPPCLFLRV